MTKIQLKRSSALNNATTSRAPSSAQLDYGELAINYNSTDPQLFIKDSSGSVIRILDSYAKVAGTTFTGDVNFDGELTIQGDSTNGSGQLTLTCEQNTHAVKIKAPAHSAAANYTLTLPSNAGSNSNVLTTDGSGNLSWALSSMTTADKNKLDGIESAATADQTGAEIKSLYEGESNTNAFTDAEKVKLSGIAAGAEVNVGTDLSYTATSRLLSSSTGGDVNLPEATPSQPGLLSAADKTKLNAIETSATADQTAAEILTAIKTVDGSGSGLDADNLDGYTWDSSGKNVRASDFYADNWFRNYNAGEGLYNIANDKHFFSASSQYWHLNSSNGLIFYDGYNASAGNATYRKGYVYWSGDGFGLLSSNGNWCVNIPPSATSSNALIVGGGASNNHYNSVSSSKMSFGGGNDFGNYHVGTNLENYGGTYTKLDLRWHTGIRMGAQSQYGGIRFYDSEDLGSLQWHFNGPSAYTYKYNWLKTNTTGIHSDTNSAHIHPNTTSSYGTWRISGSRNNYAGLMINDDQGYHNTLMWNSGNGGWYQPNGSGWTLYWHRSNSCMGIAGSSTSSSYDLYVTGAIYATGNITAYSDARKKTNIKTIESALNKVLNLRGVTYNKINVDKTVSEKDEMGVIAQEVEKIVPEVVTYAEDVDEYGVSYGNLTALLVEAIKELKIELTDLKESLA